MSAQRKKLVELVENLPDDLEQEVTDFVLFVTERRKTKFNITMSEEQAPTEGAIDAIGDFAELIEMADKHNFSSGRSDISSRTGDFAGEAIVEHFSERRAEQDANEDPR